MNPIFLVVLAAGAAGAYVLSRRNKSVPEVDRATGMQIMADVFYRVIAREPTVAGELENALNIAQNVFGLNKTVQGIRSSKGLPTDEKWPGTDLSVSAYMSEYTKQRKGAKGPKVYNDPAPVSPFQDPRPIRAQAIAAEKSNPAQAKLLHAKADVLSKLINAKRGGQQIVDAAKGLTSFLKK